MSQKKHRYRVLLVGYALIFGAYFGFKTYRFLSMETAGGEITQILLKKFTVESPRRGYGDNKYKGTYVCPQVLFWYKSATDTGAWYKTEQQALSFKEYKAGEKATVIFPKGHPELARLYSAGEFWLVPPHMIILGVVSVLWSIVYIVVVFKPWRMMEPVEMED